MLYALSPCFMLFTLYSLLFALCTMLHALCTMRVVLLTFGRFLSPVKEGAMPAPWNGSCPGEYLSFGSFAIPLAQNLSHRSHAIPLGFTPWNSFSACLLARSDRIGEDRLNLLHRGDAIPLGVQLFFKQVYLKLHQLIRRVELFYFSYPVKSKAYFTGAHTISPGASYGERSKRV